MECLIMIGWDDGLGGQQDVSWLVEADLTGQLISKLAPHWELEEKQPDVLINASRALVDVVVKCPAGAHNPLISRLLATPCLQQLFAHMFSGAPLSLSNALSIVIVLVQRYANRMDLGTDVPLDEGKADQQQQQQQLTTESDAAAANGEKTPAATEGADGGDRLPEPFHSLVPHLSRILRLLDTEAPPEADWSYGRGRAFGETRLKVVELILVLVRCKVAQVEQIFVEENLMHKLLDAFFLYPWSAHAHSGHVHAVGCLLQLFNADVRGLYVLVVLCGCVQEQHASRFGGINHPHDVGIPSVESAEGRSVHRCAFGRARVGSL
jgi:hypothetical protein